MINTKNENPVFNLYTAKPKTIGILSIPHSGEFLPEEFRTYLSSNWDDLMQDVDYRVHELVDIPKLQAAGVSVIKSNIIRTAIDLNRPKDTALFSWKSNSRGVKIVHSMPKTEEAELLIGKYYSPYYELLKTMIIELQGTMKTPSLVDLHSMPGVAEDYHLKINPNQEKIRPDFCLSDISGLSCEPEYIQKITKSLGKSYPKVTMNDPYFGGNLTWFLHATYTPLNNIQIEISRTNYMGESNKNLYDDKIVKLKEVLTNALIEHFKFYYNKYKN